jgi:hypothetical protein
MNSLNVGDILYNEKVTRKHKIVRVTKTLAITSGDIKIKRTSFDNCFVGKSNGALYQLSNNNLDRQYRFNKYIKQLNEFDFKSLDHDTLSQVYRIIFKK